MYEIITQVFIDGTRKPDYVYHKTYKRLNNARKNAVSETTKTDDGRTMELKRYVRGFLRSVSREDAKVAYAKCKNIWIDGEFGQVKIANDWEYGSHAPAEELFGRSVEQCGGYWYAGNFYIEDED